MQSQYSHVDVFSPVPYSGNSLSVFLDGPEITAAQMLKITQEMRHFESIFLRSVDGNNSYRARIFNLFGELPFAGHPIIGAAAVLHERTGSASPQHWSLVLTSKTVGVVSERTESGYFALLDQGAGEILSVVKNREDFSGAFGLQVSDLHSHLPLSVVSTGLRYLIIPVTSKALSKARIAQDITALLRTVNAEFAVLLDEEGLEIRHWNNDGIIEDIATGSAAGTVGAYRLQHGLAKSGETFILNQGRFTVRASKLRVTPEGRSDAIHSVKVGGDVALVGTGVLSVLS